MSRKIGALWVRKSKDGLKYMSGVIEDLHGNIPIAVFPNDKKESDKQPDFQIILSEKREVKQDTVSAAQDVFGDDSVTGEEKSNEKSEEINIDDIPF